MAGILVHARPASANHSGIGLHEAEAARFHPEIEDYRDARWCREGTRQIETAFDAERFIEQVGFAALPDRFAAAGAVAVRGGLRPPRRGDAAQRAEGPRSVADVAC